jgi:hypothetical protein
MLYVVGRGDGVIAVVVNGGSRRGDPWVMLIKAVVDCDVSPGAEPVHL